MAEEKPAFEGFAVVEQMGHNRYAGKISEFVLGGASLIRIEVPEIPERKVKRRRAWDPNTGEYYDKPQEVEETIPGRQAFTKFIGPNSVFSITPCTEEVARAAAEQMRAEPITCVQMPERLAIAAGAVGEDAGDDVPETESQGTAVEDADPEGQF